MSDPHQSEDPIWSRWRERHGHRPAAQADPAQSSEQLGSRGPDGAPRRPPASERLPFGAPPVSGWDHGRSGRGEGDSPRAGDEFRQDAPPPGPGGGARDAGEAVRAHAEHECLEWCPICRAAELVRANVPPELRSQLEGLQRDALVAMRALLDHYLERLDADDHSSSRVEDIPIR